MKRAIAFLLSWVLCAAAAVIGLMWMLASGLVGKGARAKRIAIAFDQVGNATAAGDEDETFSARCWRLRAQAPYEHWRRWIDRAFLVLRGEQDHCRRAFEHERDRRDRPYLDGAQP